MALLETVLTASLSAERLLVLTSVCLQRSRLTRFHDLKSVVCKACMREDRRIVSRQHWRPHHPGGHHPCLRQGGPWLLVRLVSVECREDAHEKGGKKNKTVVPLGKTCRGFISESRNLKGFSGRSVGVARMVY